MCTFSWFYVFTDVSRGVPEKACVDSALGQVTDNSIIIIIVGAGLAVSQLLGIIGSFIICCDENSYPCGRGFMEEANIAKLFAPKKQVLKSQIQTPMLVVIP
jgi:hypothetical protein